MRRTIVGVAALGALLAAAGPAEGQEGCEAPYATVTPGPWSTVEPAPGVTLPPREEPPSTVCPSVATVPEQTTSTSTTVAEAMTVEASPAVAVAVAPALTG